MQKTQIKHRLYIWLNHKCMGDKRHSMSILASGRLEALILDMQIKSSAER